MLNTNEIYFDYFHITFRLEKLLDFNISIAFLEQNNYTVV